MTQQGAIGVVLRRKPWWRDPIGLIVSWGSRSQATHAFVVVATDGTIVEAETDGARLGNISEYTTAVLSTWPLTDTQAEDIADQARKLIGTPYNWLDDLALGLARRFGMHTPEFIQRRLADPTRLQCAQLADLAYQRAGIKLFSDGRPDGDVTPGDLYDLIRADTAAVP